MYKIITGLFVLCSVVILPLNTAIASPSGNPSVGGGTPLAGGSSSAGSLENPCAAEYEMVAAYNAARTLAGDLTNDWNEECGPNRGETCLLCPPPLTTEQCNNIAEQRDNATADRDSQCSPAKQALIECLEDIGQFPQVIDAVIERIFGGAC